MLVHHRHHIIETLFDADLVLLGAADLAGIDNLAVDIDHEFMRAIMAFNAEIAFRDSLQGASGKDVFAISRKIVGSAYAAAGAEWKTGEVLVLGGVKRNAVVGDAHRRLRITQSQIGHP